MSLQLLLAPKRKSPMSLATTVGQALPTLSVSGQPPHEEESGKSMSKIQGPGIPRTDGVM